MHVNLKVQYNERGEGLKKNLTFKHTFSSTSSGIEPFNNCI